MKTKDYDSSSSGFLSDAFEGITQTFTDIEILHDTGENVLAKAKRYGRWCLLKGLSRGVVGKTAFQVRQRKELEIMLQFQHPNIVSVYGYEKIDELGSCIVMEYVDGQTLNDWLQTKPPRHERRRIAKELTSAVSYIHSKGIVHRDLKPKNIMITRNGCNVKIIDFGLADTDSYATLKQPAGTLHYMSPEQKETAVADGRNDLYSLGVIFEQMQLGWTYKSIIKRSLKPIEQRYQRAEDLQRALTARERQGTKLLFALTATLLIIFMIWNFWLQKTNSSMSDDNRIMKAQLDEQAAQRQRLTDAIQEGCHLIDTACLESGLDQHLDTLSHLRYLYPDFMDRLLSGSRVINSYCEQISTQFNEIEMAEIRNALTLHDAEYQRKWNKKLETIR